MKKLYGMGIAVLVVSLSASSANAETLKGKVVSIDPKADVIIVSPSGGAVENDTSKVSVSEFRGSKKAGDLDAMDVGQDVILNVKRGPAGTMELQSIRRRAKDTDVKMTKDKNAVFLKTKGQEKAPGRKSSEKPFEFKPAGMK